MNWNSMISQMHLMCESHVADLTHRPFVVSQLRHMSSTKVFAQITRGVELLNLVLHTRVIRRQWKRSANAQKTSSWPLAGISIKTDIVARNRWLSSDGSWALTRARWRDAVDNYGERSPLPRRAICSYGIQSHYLFDCTAPQEYPRPDL